MALNIFSNGIIVKVKWNKALKSLSIISGSQEILKKYLYIKSDLNFSQQNTVMFHQQWNTVLYIYEIQLCQGHGKS